MSTKLIEYQPRLGGKIHVYPEKMIWDVGGLTPLSGAKLIEQLVEQGLTFNPTVVLNEKLNLLPAMKKESLFSKVHLDKSIFLKPSFALLEEEY